MEPAGKEIVMTRDYMELQRSIDQVRRRMRAIALARGAALFLGLSLVVVGVAILLIDHWNYTAAALSQVRLVSLLVILALLAWFLVRPLLRKVSDAQLARYIEERNPELQERLITAVEASQHAGEPNPLLPAVIHDAFINVRKVDVPRLFNPREPRLSALIAAVLLVAAVLLFVMGPEYLRYGGSKLYANWMNSDKPPIYFVEVLPGSTTVKKGADQPISARLVGFESEDVQLFSRYHTSQSWDRGAMEPKPESNSYGFVFLDLREDARYYVKAGNVRSEEFSIRVRDIAQVERIDLTYRFPGYTGLASQKEEDGGEITAVAGTQVDVAALTNVEAGSATIVLEDGTRLPMQKKDRTRFTGAIKVRKDSWYKIELADVGKNRVSESLEYPITVVEDQPPQVAVVKPGRDRKVTKLEEVLAEAKADDDFGVRSLQLLFSVNGGKEESIDLFGGSKGTSKSISGTHTFFMEEYDLQPGDIIAYYARAKDAFNTTESDIYFLEIRPFGRDVSQSQTAGMQGGGGESASVLSARQKEILAATWRLVKDKKAYNASQYAENLRLVAGSQLKLQQEARTLTERIQRRALPGRSEEVAKLAENLRKAVDSMTPAHRFLSDKKPNEALSPEQTALQHLLRAEASFRDVQVAFGSSSGQGNSQSSAEELENLFELELDQLKNQYETLQQQRAEQTNEEVDEARRKLQELARRQQQANEARRRPMQGQQASRSGGSGSDSQSLQDQVQKLARQLERLSREAKDPELQEAARQLKEAAREMANSSQNPSNSGSQAAQNRGLQALSRMKDAQRLMDRRQQGNLSEEIHSLQQQAQELANRQQDIRSRVEQMASGNQPDGDRESQGQTGSREGERAQVGQEKEDLRRDVEGLERRLFEAARRAAGEKQKPSARELQAAGNQLKDNSVSRKIEQTQEWLRQGQLDAAKQREQTIQSALDGVRDRIAQAERSLGTSPNSSAEDRLGQALNQTGDLVENLESLRRRLEEQQRNSGQRGNDPRNGSRDQQSQGQRAEGENGEQPGQNQNPGQQSNQREGQSGQQPGDQSAQQGQQGQEGQQGQQGQRGESGQQGQGQQRGQEGNGDGNSRQPMGGTERNYAGGPAGGRDAVNFGDRDPGGAPRVSGEQLRQLEREFELRYQEARDLANQLRNRPDLASQVRQLMEGMRKMPPGRLLADAGELERLQKTVIEGFRQVELDLSKQLQSLVGRENLRLAKDEQVPEAYRKQVEDYYKALSSGKAE